MFRLARKIVQHKIGVIAVVAVAVVMFSGNGDDEEAAKSSSPWAHNAPEAEVQSGNSGDGSFTAKLGEVAVAAGDVAAEKLLGDKDLNPVKLGDDAVNNFDNANSAFGKANGNN